jgi:hypothetical protein
MPLLVPVLETRRPRPNGRRDAIQQAGQAEPIELAERDVRLRWLRPRRRGRRSRRRTRRRPPTEHDPRRCGEAPRQRAIGGPGCRTAASAGRSPDAAAARAASRRVYCAVVPASSWLFLRGDQSIWVERPLGFMMVVAGPGTQREEHEFGDEAALQDYQGDLADRLTAAGWFLAALDHDRRQKRDRRSLRRDSPDRRSGPRHSTA